MSRTLSLTTQASIALAAALVLSTPGAAQEPHHPTVRQPAALLSIPESMRAEHEEIHAELVRATKAPGKVGQAARELAKVLDPHFVREEQIALPPLGLLLPLSNRVFTPEMLAVIPMTDTLRAELPKMIDEHEVIRAATLRMGEVARKAGNARVARLAEKLALHAKTEEQVNYPAALVVGEMVRERAKTASAQH